VAAAPILVVQNDRSDPLGVLGDWLTGAGAALDVRDMASGATLPASVDGVGGIVVLGGGMRATDDQRAPWLPRLRALLAEALSREVPVLGVCLGGQLLALAAGGEVGPNPDGPEIGAQLIAKRAAAATDPLFGPLPITPDVLQWHVDAVTRLPPGAVLLATSPSCEVQAFRVGRLAWGFQFHIETTPAVVQEWAAEDSGTVSDYDLECIVARSDAVHADIAETWQPVAASFAGIVANPAAVRPARPIAATTAAPITDPAQIRAALAAEMHAATGHPLPAALPYPRLSEPPPEPGSPPPEPASA
jgi:GMP synthase (glutamine-hydrolysing)